MVAEGALWMLAAAVAGGLGAVARYVIDTVVTRTIARRGREAVLPWGTLVVNFTGSFAIGVLTGWVYALGNHPLWLVFGVGFLGGYTTLSTASLDTVRLLQRGRVAAAVVNGFGQLLVAVAAVLLGVVVGSLI